MRADVSVQLVLPDHRRHLRLLSRLTLVFDVREGEIDGTDIGGDGGGADRRHAEGHDGGGTGVSPCSSMIAASDGQAEKLGQVFGGQLGGPMAALESAWWERDSASSVAPISAPRRSAAQRPHRRRDRDFEISRTSCPSAEETGEPVHQRHVPPRGIRPNDGGGEPFLDQRLRDRVRGQDGLVEVRVLVGGVSRSVVSSGRAGRSSSPRRSPPLRARLSIGGDPARAGSSACRLVADGCADGRYGCLGRGPTSAP